MVKVKEHRGEPLNERADTQAEREDNCRQSVDNGPPAHPECCTHGKTKA
jgi:hypothetical protein